MKRKENRSSRLPGQKIPAARLSGKVRKTIAKFRLLRRGDRVLIACSGGADSMALLAVLLELQPIYSLRLALAHFNHRLRRSADRDEQFVIQVSRRHGLPLYSKREDLRAYAAGHGLNLEEAARLRRYDFLKRTAARIGATKIATGHTMSDQAETVLMRLLRGSGPTGLAGIAPLSDDRIIRPLLELEKSEILAYLEEKRISFCEDETNRDLRYLRNRVRLRLIPYLEKRFEPRIVRGLARLAEISRGDEEWLNQVMRPVIKKALIRGKGVVWLNARTMAKLPAGPARRTVREFIAALKGDLRRISFENVEAVRRLKSGDELRLPGGLTLGREKDRIFLSPRPPKPQTYEYLWDGQRTLKIDPIGLCFCGRKIRRGKPLRLRFADDRRAYFDAARLRFPLVVRSRRPGDRYRPLGAPGRKKVKEMMRARGIPPSERERHPVFLSAGQMIWALGLPVAEDFKVTPQTRDVFIIQKTMVG